jgi:DNA-binding MarR family transcriptional regulator
VDATKHDMGFLISDACRCLNAVLAEDLRNHGLDHPRYVVLYHAQRAGAAGVSTKSLADILRLSPSEIDERIARLRRDGWITASPDPASRGSSLVRLTAKADAAVPVLADASHWAIERALNGFSADEAASLTEYLERLRTNLR